MKVKKQYFVSGYLPFREIRMARTIAAYSKKQAAFLYKKLFGFNARDIEVEEVLGPSPRYEELDLFN